MPYRSRPGYSMLLSIRHIPSTVAATAFVTFTTFVAGASVATFLYFRRHSYSSSTKKLPQIGPHISTTSLADETVMNDLHHDVLLVFFAKSSQEKHIAETIKSKKDTLKIFEDQGEVRVLLQFEIDPIDSFTFQVNPYMDALMTEQFGRLLIWSPRLPSTHDVVSKNFNELPIGTTCVTDVQYKGRGRGKNVWESPAGCLMFSFTMQIEDGHKVPLLQYVVSLGLTEAIKEICQENGLPQIDVKIKWPNDLYLNGLKVGGILCTSTYTSKKFNISAGVGLNLDNDKPTTSLNAALLEMTSVSHRLEREDILAAFFNNFEKLFKVFLHQGFQVLEELYYKSWLHSGQKVVIEEKQDDLVLKSVVTVKGLTSSGYLLATDDENRNFELHPDGNSFDFFKGLVRRKLD